MNTPSEAPSTLPLKGFVVWNSRGLTPNNTHELWINLYLPEDTRPRRHD